MVNRMKKQSGKTKKTTIYDVAAEAGTSSATVSRVLSNSGYPVKEEVRQRIIDAAKKLNYTPNMVGRMLKKNVSMDIGVIIPTISNPFYSQIILGIEQEARQRGYNILLCNSFRDSETERKYINSLYQKQVRGIVISSIGENHDYLKELQENGVRIAVFDQSVDDLKCSKVGFNYVKGGLMAVEHLINMGHRKIVFATSPLTRKSRRETMEGFKLALLKHGIPFSDEDIIESESEEETENGTYEFENGRKLAEKLLGLKEKPTAVFAVNDMTAIGIIQGLSGHGIRIPEDISVIGFDNIEVSSMINPPLTTVNQPSFETGRLACKLLLDSMNDNGYEDVSIVLEPSLIVRESVKNLALET